MVEGRVDARKMPSYFSSEFDEFGDAAAGCPGKPAAECVFAFLAVEFQRGAQAFLEQPGAGQQGLGLADPGELGLLVAGEVLGVFPQRVPGALEAAGAVGGDAHGPAAAAAGGDLPGGPGLPPGLAADLVEGIGGPGDDVERVIPTPGSAPTRFMPASWLCRCCRCQA